jgi:hypothetical protein
VGLEARDLVDLVQVQVFLAQLVLDQRFRIRNLQARLAVGEEVSELAFFGGRSLGLVVLVGLASDDCFEYKVSGLRVVEEKRSAFLIDGAELLDAFLQDVGPS